MRHCTTGTHWPTQKIYIQVVHSFVRKQGRLQSSSVFLILRLLMAGYSATMHVLPKSIFYYKLVTKASSLPFSCLHPVLMVTFYATIFKYFHSEDF